MDRRTLDVALLCGLKATVAAWVIHAGFTHVSDDDYARTVIAEQFAHAPRIDPSGTSWLPLPFWIEGSVMIVLGRSLGVARGVAVVLGVASVAAPYVAMRVVGVTRPVAWIATAVALALPWNAWLGVATVPEAWVGALVAASLIAMTRERARPWATAGLLAASLSRYEAWPACAVAGTLFAWQAASRFGSQRRAALRELALAALVVAGPVAWMAWNAVVHGSALHFVARVATFRHAFEGANLPVSAKLLDYPRALAFDTPEVLLLGALGAGALANPVHRVRWAWPLSGALAILVFLIWGDLRDGAPTHHAARALAPTWWIFSASGIDAAWTLWERFATPRPRRISTGVVAAATAIAWCAWLPVRWTVYPGRSDAERRDRQVALGLEMRADGVTTAEIVPCAYEHFAVLAAWGRPEGAKVDKGRTRSLEETAGATCPLVTRGPGEPQNEPK
jgi:hypothetical protein